MCSLSFAFDLLRKKTRRQKNKKQRKKTQRIPRCCLSLSLRLHSRKKKKKNVAPSNARTCPRGATLCRVWSLNRRFHSSSVDPVCSYSFVFRSCPEIFNISSLASKLERRESLLRLPTKKLVPVLEKKLRALSQLQPAYVILLGKLCKQTGLELLKSWKEVRVAGTDDKWSKLLSLNV